MQAAGYSADVIANIKSGVVEDQLLQTVFERAKLSKDELKNLGYSSAEIVSMKNLTGDETLDEVAPFALAYCTTYNTYMSHTYKPSTNKTYFLCAYGWSWDKCPAWLLTDAAGCGWNHEFHPDNSVGSTYNVSYKTYVNQLNASDKKYTQKNLYEKTLQTCEDQFDMNGYYGSNYYVQSGHGTMALSQTGKINDVKFAFKYGHNQLGPAVSVSYPWGIGFGLEGAETIFQPNEIVYHDFAVTVNS
ncbi:hypothetical protein EVA_06992 [gut metagenome]|uniref:Uncharacterized protein n=1 Tax=gut metagenome TaxID=749906 RepID=J9GQX9_9ZZZZ